MKNKVFIIIFAFFIIFQIFFCFSRNLLCDDYLQYVKKEFASPKDYVLQDQNKHFIVICPDQVLAQKILKREVQLYQKFHKTFKTLTFWENPAVVKIFPDRSSYVSQYKSFTSQAFMAKFKKDSRTHRLIASWIQEDLIEDLIPHETAHIFIADLARIDEINSSQGNKRVLPRWIDEGIAQYFQTHNDMLNYKIYIMHMAFKEKGHMSFNDFFGSTNYPDNTYYFYIQSEVMTYFLLSRPNGYKKMRNYITIFRSKVKDGRKAFTLSFPEYANFKKLRKDFIIWSREKLKKYHPDIDTLNKKISKIYKVKKYNKNLYKEIAMGVVAYQLHLNADYSNSVKLASAALQQKNGFSLAYEAQIKSLLKMDNAKTAEQLLALYQRIDPRNSYKLLADLKHEERKYGEEISWLKKLLEIDQENGYFICMRIATIYQVFLRDYQMANFYASEAERYSRNLNEFH